MDDGSSFHKWGIQKKRRGREGVEEMKGEEGGGMSLGKKNEFTFRHAEFLRDDM